MELFKAHRQWATRPADERFPDLETLSAATAAYARSAGEVSAPWSELRTEAIDGDVQLIGKANQPAKLTHWSFGQLAARVGAPADYLRDLPATLACQNLNHGLAHRREKDGSALVRGSGPAQILFHTNGSLLARAITSDKYARIWNYEVAERLLELVPQGWEPATPDIRPGDAATALYASDHDLFAFLRNRNLTIEEKGGGAVYRGTIIENSEVGASALKATRFLYREMCGNHIIWGASHVIDLSVRHVGSAGRAMQRWAYELRKLSNESASDEEAKIASAQTTIIADTKEGVLDKLFGLRQLNVSRKTLEAGYAAVDPDQDGDPRSVWGIVQGLTRHSQTIPYADKRTDVDRAAGKLLAINF